MALTKKFKKIRQELPAGKVYSVKEALPLLKKHATAKFKEGVDVAVVLGIDATKSDQNIRSAVVLPHGTGKTARVAVFAQGANADAAKAAGADVVGFDDLAASMKAGELNYDVVIASPDAMRVVGQLGTILGPRGLMPNPKVGTVTADVATAVKNAKSGQVRYRSDKGGVVHANIGRADFTDEQLHENLKAFVADLKRVKPAAAKGTFIKKVALSSTMGPGFAIETASIEA